jgi:hypothetical protein
MGRDTLEDRIRKDPDIICGDDGFFVYWPTEHRGAYSPHHLRMIADELDRRNKDWEEELNKYFENKA